MRIMYFRFHTSLSEVLHSCNEGDITHLASEALVEQNVACCQVSVHERLS